MFHADLNWETELNCHLHLFRAANPEKQGIVQNIFSHTPSARERSPLDPPREHPGPSAGDREEKRPQFLPHSTPCSLSKPNQEVGETAHTWCNLPRSAGLPGASLSPGICSGALHLCSLTVGRAGTPQLAPRRTGRIHRKPSKMCSLQQSCCYFIRSICNCFCCWRAPSPPSLKCIFYIN